MVRIKLRFVPTDLLTLQKGKCVHEFLGHRCPTEYSQQSMGLFQQASEDRVNLNSPLLFRAIRSLVKKGADPDSAQTLKDAVAMATDLAKNSPKSPYQWPRFGYCIQWVSEMGDERVLNGLLRHADDFLNPTWERGGFFYRRNTDIMDRNGNWTMVDPFTGNAAIGYARLNIPDGQRIMWQKPWKGEEVRGRPFVDSIDLGCGVDFIRGAWDSENGIFVLTMRSWNNDKRSQVPHSGILLHDKAFWFLILSQASLRRLPTPNFSVRCIY